MNTKSTLALTFLIGTSSLSFAQAPDAPAPKLEVQAAKAQPETAKAKIKMPKEVKQLQSEMKNLSSFVNQMDEMKVTILDVVEKFFNENGDDLRAEYDNLAVKMEEESLGDLLAGGEGNFAEQLDELQYMIIGGLDFINDNEMEVTEQYKKFAAKLRETPLSGEDGVASEQFDELKFMATDMALDTAIKGLEFLTENEEKLSSAYEKLPKEVRETSLEDIMGDDNGRSFISNLIGKVSEGL